MSRIRSIFNVIVQNIPLIVALSSLGVGIYQFYVTGQPVWAWVGVLSAYIIPVYITRRHMHHREYAIEQCLADKGLELEKTGVYEYTILNDPNDN